MPANGRRDLIRLLKVNVRNSSTNDDRNVQIGILTYFGISISQKIYNRDKRVFI